MEKFKNYKSYYIYSETLKTQNKIKVLKELLKVNTDNWEDFDKWFYHEAMTKKQYQLYINKDFKTLKELLKKQIKK